MIEIKNIIFDLGVVLLNINFGAAESEFKKLGINNLDEVYFKINQSKIFERFEEGKINETEFCKKLINYFNPKISKEEFDRAWNAVLLDFPENRINFVIKLKKRYRLFLLSNTNPIHDKFYKENFRIKYGFEFSELFEKMYLSFEVGLRKPDVRIFNLILKNQNLEAGETLFIDDIASHVESAQKAGINAYLLKPGEEINEILSSKFQISNF